MRMRQMIGTDDCEDETDDCEDAADYCVDETVD